MNRLKISDIFPKIADLFSGAHLTTNMKNMTVNKIKIKN